MKTLTISLITKNLFGAIALLLSVSGSTIQQAQAQTFARENRLDENPASLPALIYPTNQAQTIRVNAHNQQRGPLTIVIRDANGKVKHTETTFASKYIGRFNLAPLGEGTYTFELSNEAGDSFTRAFRIETATPRVIALGDPNEKPFDPKETLGSLIRK